MFKNYHCRSLFKFSKGRVVVQKNIDINNKSLELTKNGRFNENANWIEAEFVLNDAKKMGFNVAEKMGSDPTKLPPVFLFFLMDM